MRIRFSRQYIVLAVVGLQLLLSAHFAVVQAQPFDLIVPTPMVAEPLTTELRTLQSIERDLALERLLNTPDKIKAYIELGDLRRTQGRLEEAKRFYRMALDIQPSNYSANEGLAMVYHHEGDFRACKQIFEQLQSLYPISERLQRSLDRVRGDFRSSGEVGIRIHEDSRGLQEIAYSVEAFIPSLTHPRLSSRYRLETWNFKDGPARQNSRIIAGTLEYSLDHRNRVAATFAPETFSGDISVNQYQFRGVTGSGPLHAELSGGRASFRENIAVTRLGLHEDYASISLFGELNERARVIQTFSTADLSDGNSRRSFNSQAVYFVYRRGVPFLSLDLRLGQSNYELQSAADGSALVYWAPQDFRSVHFGVGWEKAATTRWWYGLETMATRNSFRTLGRDTSYEQGLGVKLHASYRLRNGRYYAEFCDAIKDFYRERSIALFGSLDF